MRIAALLTIAICAGRPALAQSTAPRMTEPYVRMVARDAYFWAWPMLNVYSRRLAFKNAPEPGLYGGNAPVAPLNRLSMLTNYVEADARLVACPNQDVVSGAAVIALDLSPVVIQVPDFGKRFWIYQVVDLRTDAFATLGAMYATRPGFYLLAGPGWKGTVPKGITKVFRAKSNTGVVIPRVFQEGTPEDNKTVQAVLNGIDLYPLSQYTGKMKLRDWSKSPKFPAPAAGESEMKWVEPERFVEELALVMKDAPPLPGEEGYYARISAVLAAAQRDSSLKAAMIDEAVKAEKEVVTPLFEFRNFGISLPDHWSTQNNGAMFGMDYLTRTAVAKSNIFVSKPTETRSYYQDLDESGERLNGANRYTVTFVKHQLPPARAFWSLTLYNEHHFFAANDLRRYSLGTKNKDLKLGTDSSLTIYIQADSPGADKESNWLPAPKDADFSLYIRAYWPETGILKGSWTPPTVWKTM